MKEETEEETERESEEVARNRNAASTIVRKVEKGEELADLLLSASV